MFQGASFRKGYQGFSLSLASINLMHTVNLSEFLGTLMITISLRISHRYQPLHINTSAALSSYCLDSDCNALLANNALKHEL